MKLRKYIRDNFPLDLSDSFITEHPKHIRIMNLWEENLQVYTVHSTEYSKVISFSESLNPTYAINKIRVAIEDLLLDISTSPKYRNHPPEQYECKLYYDYQITYYTHSDKHRVHISINIEPAYISLFCDNGHRYDENRTCPCQDHEPMFSTKNN